MNGNNGKNGEQADILATDETVSNDRRRLLALMGIAATTAYVAPTLLSMNKAHASGRSGGGRGGSGRSGGGRGGSGRSGSGRGGFGGGSGRSGRSFGGGRSLGSGNPIRSIGRAFRGIFN